MINFNIVISWYLQRRSSRNQKIIQTARGFRGKAWIARFQRSRILQGENFETAGLFRQLIVGRKNVLLRDVEESTMLGYRIRIRGTFWVYRGTSCMQQISPQARPLHLHMQITDDPYNSGFIYKFSTVDWMTDNFMPSILHLNFTVYSASYSHVSHTHNNILR